jgi:hypothetical protein
MAQTNLRQRIIGNPGRRKKRSRNPGEILGFVLGPAGNPGRKRGSMAAKRKANRGTPRRRKARSNPGMKMARRNRGAVTHHRRRRHRTNPGVRRHHRRRNPGALGDIGPMFTNAVFVIVGALGSKLGAQAFLGTNNVGLVGYAGNAAVGGVLWFLAEKVMHNRAAANGIIAGTLVQILLRVINDYTPFGSYVANLGMGDYQAQSFVTPQVLVDPWRSAQIQIPSGWGASAPPMIAGAGAGQMGRSAVPAMAAKAAAASGGGGVNGYGTQALYGGGANTLY